MPSTQHEHDIHTEYGKPRCSFSAWFTTWIWNQSSLFWKVLLLWNKSVSWGCASHWARPAGEHKTSLEKPLVVNLFGPPLHSSGKQENKASALSSKVAWKAQPHQELVQFVTETKQLLTWQWKVSLAWWETLLSRQDTEVSVLLSFKFFRQSGRVPIKDWEQPHSPYHGSLNIGCSGPVRQEFVTSSAKAITRSRVSEDKGYLRCLPPHGSGESSSSLPLLLWCQSFKTGMSFSRLMDLIQTKFCFFILMKRSIY